MQHSNPSLSISVVIVSYNTKLLIKECIESVAAQLDLSRDDIWVVDNASADNTSEMIKNEFPQVHLFESPSNRGFSYACNIGWRKSKNPFVLFTNGDIRFPNGEVQKMRDRILEDEKIGILSPLLMGENNTLQQMTWGWNISLSGEMKQKLFAPKNVMRHTLVRNMVTWLQRRERDVAIVAGACMLARRDMLDKIDCFDEDFELYFEDADLCVRCWKAGYRVHFSPGIQVIHGLGQSGKSNPTKIDLVYRQSQIAFYRKHHRPFKIVLLKIYILMKFFTHTRFWKDPVFRYFILEIVREKRRIHLEDNLSVIPS
jgi:GT2 family glycosyltransferase